MTVIDRSTLPQRSSQHCGDPLSLSPSIICFDFAWFFSASLICASLSWIMAAFENLEAGSVETHGCEQSFFQLLLFVNHDGLGRWPTIWTNNNRTCGLWSGTANELWGRGRRSTLSFRVMLGLPAIWGQKWLCFRRRLKICSAVELQIKSRKQVKKAFSWNWVNEEFARTMRRSSARVSWSPCGLNAARLTRIDVLRLIRSSNFSWKLF